VILLFLAFVVKCNKYLARRGVAKKTKRFKIGRHKTVLLILALAFIAGAVFYTLFFERKSADSNASCYAGAYHKKDTAVGDYIGVGGKVKLGVFFPDGKRYKVYQYQGVNSCKSMDSPSIYMGIKQAVGGKEIDVGLNWEISKNAEGALSQTQNSYRPFWRIDGWNSAPVDPKYTWFSGDVIKVDLVIIGDGKMKFTVQDAQTNPKKIFETELDVPGVKLAGSHESKMITSIDQFGNENQLAKKTNAQLLKMEWWERHLVDSSQKRIPLNSKVINSSAKCLDKNIKISQIKRNVGGETIAITGEKNDSPAVTTCNQGLKASSTDEQHSTYSVNITDKKGKAKGNQKYKIVNTIRECTFSGTTSKCGKAVKEKEIIGTTDANGKLSMPMELFTAGGRYFVGKDLFGGKFSVWQKADIYALNNEDKSLGKKVLNSPVKFLRIEADKAKLKFANFSKNENQLKIK